jgi:flagellar biosynthesis protein FlhA
VPALIVSIAAGFLVSKAGVEGSADKALVKQLATNPVSLGMVSAASGVLALVPGMPILPFAAIALGAGALAWKLGRKAAQPVTDITTAAGPAEDVEEPISNALAIDDVKIELGYALLALINDLEGRRLTDQIRALRRTLAAEYGFVMPAVRILDNMRLPNQGYSVKIKEMEAGSGEVRLGLADGHGPAGTPGRSAGETREGARLRPAGDLDPRRPARGGDRSAATPSSIPATVLTTHLTEVLKEAMPTCSATPRCRSC